VIHVMLIGPLKDVVMYPTSILSALLCNKRISLAT